MIKKILFRYAAICCVTVSLISCGNLVEPKHNNTYDPLNPEGYKIVPEITHVTLDNENNFTLYWNYPTSNAGGYILERKINDEIFKEIFKGPKKSLNYREVPNISNIYHYRIRAYYQEYKSDYSNELMLTYKNEEVYKLNIKYKAYHNHISNLIAFSSDFEKAATVTNNINIVNPQLSKTIMKQLPIDSGIPPYTIAFNEDGSYFIDVTSNAVAEIWETRKWYLFKQLQLNKNYKIVKMINADYLVCSGVDNSIDVYSLLTDSLFHSFTHDEVVTNLVYNKTSNTIITTGNDNKIIIWSLTNFEKLLETTFSSNIDFISFDDYEYKILVLSGNKIAVLNYNDLSIDFTYQRTSPDKILNAYFEKNNNGIVFNTEKNVWLLNTSNFTDENMLTLPDQYEYMFAHKSLKQFFIGGYPLIGFEIKYSTGYWDSNL